MDRRIGAQMFTLRDHCKTVEDFDKTCQRVKEMGYKTVQISAVPLKAEEIRPVLDKHGLVALTSHRSGTDFFAKVDEVIEYNKILGCDLCGLGGMSSEAHESKESLDKFIKDINAVCEKIKKAGMYFGYHNHAFEFSTIDGKRIIDRLIEETDPEVFKFIVDVHWVQYGGMDPARFIEKLGERAMAVHFKDYGIVLTDRSERVIKEVGYGNLDWDSIIEACDKAGTRWAFVEHDNTWTNDDPFLSMKMSYDFLTTKGFN